MRIPFSFEKIDITFRDLVVTHCRENMYKGGTIQLMASFCYARYLSRSDSVIGDTVSGITKQIHSEMEKDHFSLESVHLLNGAFTFLSNLYKIGDRKKLRPTNSEVFDAVAAVLEVFENFEDEKKK